MEESNFTKIIKGELPCHKVYEDDFAVAFMDIHPIQPGHVLVVPKSQVGSVWELSDDDYQALMTAVKKVGQKLKEAFPDKERVGIMIEGLEAPDHAHIKVFPFSTDQEYRNQPNPNAVPDREVLAKMAQKLKIN